MDRWDRPPAADTLGAMAERTEAEGRKMGLVAEALAEQQRSEEKLRDEVRALTAQSRKDHEELARLSRAVASTYESAAAEGGRTMRAAMDAHMGDLRRQAKNISDASADMTTASVEAIRAASLEAEGALREVARSTSDDMRAAAQGVRSATDDQRRALAVRAWAPWALAIALTAILGLLCWRCWPTLTGTTMTDLDAANLTIQKQDATIRAYQDAGPTLTTDQQASLDRQLASLQGGYDESHG